MCKKDVRERCAGALKLKFTTNLQRWKGSVQGWQLSSKIPEPSGGEDDHTFLLFKISKIFSGKQRFSVIILGGRLPDNSFLHNLKRVHMLWRTSPNEKVNFIIFKKKVCSGNLIFSGDQVGITIIVTQHRTSRTQDWKSKNENGWIFCPSSFHLDQKFRLREL